MTQEQLKLLQKYEAKGFDRHQMREIEDAIEFGLTEEEIDIIANSKYDIRQMKQAGKVLKYNKTAEQKLTEEQIKFVTNPDLEWFKMKFIRICYEHNVPQNEIDELLNKNFLINHFLVIADGLDSNLSIDEVKIYAKSEYSHSQMDLIRKLLIYNQTAEVKLTQEQMNFIANPDLKLEEMRIAQMCFKHNVPQKEVENIFKLNDSRQLMRDIANGFSNNLTFEEIKLSIKEPKTYRKAIQEQMAKTNLNKEQFKYVENIPTTFGKMFAMLCYEREIPQDEIDELLSRGLGNTQINEMNKGLKNGLTINKIKLFAYPDLTVKEMERIRKDIEKDLKQNPEQNSEISLDELIKATEEISEEIKEHPLTLSNEGPTKDDPTKGDKLGGGLGDR